MKWKILRLLMVVALLFVAVLVAPSVAWRWREYSLTRQAKLIQSALESYRQQHGSYPESLSTASILETEEIYYQHQPDGTYIIWFGMELGESVTFCSPDRRSQ